MKIMLPSALVRVLLRLPFMRSTRYYAEAVAETPSPAEMRSDRLLFEVRDGHLKWAHLVCPKCAAQIQLPLAGKQRWTLKVDFLRRPTLSPSIWEIQSCGAHFFVRKGRIAWCAEESGISDGNA